MIDDLKKINIRSIELRRISLPLVTPFRTSFSTETHRDILLVRVETDDAVGWGECVSGNEPLYSNEYVEGSQQVMIDHLIPRLFAFRSRPMSAHDVAQILRPVKDHRMAKAALEAAILDAQLRENNVSLATHLGSIHELVPSGVSVGIANSLDELVATVGGYLDEGYARIKLKIEPGWDIEPVRVIRKTFGDQVPLQVDANTAFTREDGPLLAQLDPFNLLLIEQPLPEDDITGHALIARQVKTPICLDESIVSAHVAIDAIERGACSIVNIKAGRVGGYLEAVRIHNVCQQRGVPVWCGGMLETGIGRAMNVALAGLPNFTLTGDISASERFWKQDIVQQPIRLESGQVRLPSGSGAGFEIDGPFLSDVSTSTITLRSEG
ncbi:MAG: mandelate racemase/muconate lactonizing protein [Actinomycetota bacterium]|jgi:O-succinylbenzoate synthase